MRLAESPDDFRVEELPLYPPSGEGTHTFVFVEKRERTTEEVVRVLAREAGVAPRDVGYAGRKDRRAVTRQWLSVPGLAPERALTIDADGVRVLEATPHGHKLRTGQLRGNRFELVVRELSAEQVEAAASSLAALVAQGMPNRFGPQRFGREGDNAVRGRELLAGAPLGRDRRRARFWLSALQAEVFNAWMDERPRHLDAIAEGEVAWVHASGAAFVVEDVAEAAARAGAFEISAAGPLFGTRLLEAQGEAGRAETALFARLGIPWPVRPPRGVRLRGARRPIRVRPEQSSAEPAAADAVRLRFDLPSGSYATVLVAALFAAPEAGA